MKSYVEPLNAEEALEILKRYAVPCDSAQSIGGGAVNVSRNDGMVTCMTPDELADALGPAAAAALETHKAFRLEAIHNYLGPALENKDWIYNLESTMTIIPSLNEKGELQGVLCCYGDYHGNYPKAFAECISKGNLTDSATLLKEFLDSPIKRMSLSEENVVQRPPRDLAAPVNDSEFQETIEQALSDMEWFQALNKFECNIDLSDDRPIGYQLERDGWTLGNERSMTYALSVSENIKSYTRPLTVLGAVEVLRRYGFRQDWAKSQEKFGAVDIYFGHESKRVETPMELAHLFGEKAVSALEAHESFRSRILNEVINPCLNKCPEHAIYNVKTGETFIAQPAALSFYGFRSAVIPLQELLGRCGSGQLLNARFGYFDKLGDDPSGTTLIEDGPAVFLDREGCSEVVASANYLRSVNAVLDKMEIEAIERSPDGLPDFDAGGWCIGDSEHIAEACERVGIDIDSFFPPEPEESLDDMAQAVESAFVDADEYEYEDGHEEEIPR